MKLYDEAFFKTVRDFLTVYLPRQRCLSPNTVTTYRYALNLFINYLMVSQGLELRKIGFEHLTAETVSEFIEWLKTERNCSVATVNQRLMAIRAFSKYAGLIDITKTAISAEIANIPVQKSPTKPVEYLSEEALKALLSQPNMNKSNDYRNRFFMILMYDTAARCQELLDLRLRDIELDTKHPFIYLNGKGRKLRTVPIMPETVKHYLAYLKHFHPENTRNIDDHVFYTTIRGKRGQMSPDTVAHFMKSYGVQARVICPSMPQRVHPHQLRHTRVIHLYRGGLPIALLSEFMGHAEVSTTQIYAYADTEMKRAALEKIRPSCASELTDEKPIWKDNDTMLRKLYGL